MIFTPPCPVGMEVAAYLSNKAASVACIDLTAVPFERVLGERVGKMLQTMHEEKGVKFYLGSGVKEIVGDEGKVTGVMLPSGETLEADVVVAGVGKTQKNTTRWLVPLVGPTECVCVCARVCVYEEAFVLDSLSSMPLTFTISSQIQL